MKKAPFYLIAILSILLSFNTYQVSVYEQLSYILISANETLTLDFKATRGLWKSCKFFRWCDERHGAPDVFVISVRESHFTA